MNLHCTDTKHHKLNHSKCSSGWWFQPIWKILVKMGSSSPNRDENFKIFELPPPSHANKQRGQQTCHSCRHLQHGHGLFARNLFGSTTTKPRLFNKNPHKCTKYNDFLAGRWAPRSPGPNPNLFKKQKCTQKKCEYNNYMNYIYISCIQKTIINTTGLRSIHGFLQEKTRFCFQISFLNFNAWSSEMADFFSSRTAKFMVEAGVWRFWSSRIWSMYSKHTNKNT